jgi:prevent-host-death family protein
MQSSNISEKTIGAFEARRQFGKVLQDVLAKGDKFVVERNGEPIAAVVPIQLYRQWKQRREAFFAQMREAAVRSQQHEAMSEEETMGLVNHEIKEYRAEKRLK